MKNIIALAVSISTLASLSGCDVSQDATIYVPNRESVDAVWLDTQTQTESNPVQKAVETPVVNEYSVTEFRELGSSGADGNRKPFSLDLNLTSPEDNLYAFTKVRGSLEPGDEVVFYWTGRIYLAEQADFNGSAVTDYPGPIMRFEGFNIARFLPTEDGIRMLSREIAVYQDLSGNIINCWNNTPLKPQSPEMVPVVHVHNDPVNSTISGGEHFDLGEQVVWTKEVMRRYPNPLPVTDYPLYSTSNTYESAEMFNFYSNRADLNDPSQASVPVTLSWSRVGQPLPWMRAGQTSSKLIYHTHGRKLLGGFHELPTKLKNYVINHAPNFATAPKWDISPNTTSWRYFRSVIDSGKYQSTCN